MYAGFLIIYSFVDLFRALANESCVLFAPAASNQSAPLQHCHMVATNDGPDAKMSVDLSVWCNEIDPMHCYSSHII